MMQLKLIIYLKLILIHKKITEKDFNLQDIKRDKNTITINYIRDTIKVTTILSLCDRANFGRYEIQISAENNPLNMSMVSLMPFKTQAPFVYGSFVSSPIISDSFFVIPENPLTNMIAYEGGVTQKITQAIHLVTKLILAFMQLANYGVISISF